MKSSQKTADAKQTAKEVIAIGTYAMLSDHSFFAWLCV